MLLRLTTTSNRLPSSIFISGVVDCDEHPTFGGGYGEIYRATYGKKLVAVKRLRVWHGQHEEAGRAHFIREALVWQNLRNPYVVPLIGVDRETFFPSLAMVSPWCQFGTIVQYLKDHGRQTVNKLCSEVAQGLLYLHSQNIVHGDLRGTNTLVTEEQSACLTDFGLTTFFDLPPTTVSPNPEYSSSPHSDRRGSIRFMAPELIAPDGDFVRTPSSDVYAFGCVCLELHTGKPPFEGSSDAAVIMKVLNGERPERRNGGLEAPMSDQLWEYVNTFWAQAPTSRPSAQSVAHLMATLV
ncbi:kinase-like domain-containing protein [Mycena polygramma]|nr:kinase-like domain-containing protein [Mycena polygramma]